MNSTETRCRGACPSLPESLVRLRYFFGKRLGVADFRDEQSYHRNKQRLHNRHVHGAGVLCGLAVTPFDGEAPDSPLIRVSAGAALDTCGREIVVGHAQCIDLAAWFARRREEAEAAGETFPPAGAIDAEHILALCIAVRYRECETTPESAPRDPCACDTGGCEFGRIEEGYELAVLLADEAEPYRTRLRFPPVAILAEIVAAATDAEDLLARLADAQTADCPEARNPDWILLGCLGLALDADHTEVQALIPEEAWSGPPETLLSTSAIQELLALLLACCAQPEAPEMGGALGASIAVARSESSGLVLRVTPDEPVVAESLSHCPFRISRLRPGIGWDGPRFTDIGYEADEGSLVRELDLAFRDNFLEPGGRYRLSTSRSSRAIVDERLRPLRLELGFEIHKGERGMPQLAILFQRN